MFHRVFANPPPGRLDLVRLHLKGGHMREEPLLSMYFLLLQDVQYSSLFTLHNLPSILHTIAIAFHAFSSTFYTVCAQCTQCTQCAQCTLYVHTCWTLHTVLRREVKIPCVRNVPGISTKPAWILSPQTEKSLLFLQKFCLISFAIFKYHFQKV